MRDDDDEEEGYRLKELCDRLPYLCHSVSFLENIEDAALKSYGDCTANCTRSAIVLFLTTISLIAAVFIAVYLLGRVMGLVFITIVIIPLMAFEAIVDTVTGRGRYTSAMFRDDVLMMYWLAPKGYREAAYAKVAQEEQGEVVVEKVQADFIDPGRELNPTVS